MPATMNGTRCAISPEMKATSRERRSSLATTTGHLALRAASKRGGELRTAVERIGAFAGLHLHELRDQRHAFGFGKAGTVLRCASMPRPDALPLGGDSVVGDADFM